MEGVRTGGREAEEGGGLGPTHLQAQLCTIPGERVLIKEKVTQRGHHTGVLT